MTNQEKNELADLLYELAWNTRRLRDHYRESEYQESEALRGVLRQEANEAVAWANKLRNEASNG